MTTMSRRSIAILFVAGLVLSAGASPQTQTTGRITGTVKDAQGAVIVGAELRVENAATGDRHPAVTDSSGTYSILQLPTTLMARSGLTCTSDCVEILQRAFDPH